MSLQAFLEWFTRGSIVLLAILLAMQWLRWRDRVSLDIALVFGSLASLLATEWALALSGFDRVWLRPLGISVLLAHPYLLLRVVSHFRPVSAFVRRSAAIGLALALVPTWIAASPFRASGLVVLAFIYFVWLLIYDAWAFAHGAGKAGGVTHWRMRHAAIGAGVLAGLFVVAALVAVVPATRGAGAALIPVAGLSAALNYYIAFAPPSWLRRLWQSAELYGFLSGGAMAGHSPSEDEVLSRLCAFAAPAVGGTSAAAARWDDEQQRLIVRVSRWGYLEPGRPVPEGRLTESSRTGTAMHVKQHEWVLPGGAPGSVYIVPIPCDIGAKGLLFVLLPKSALFVSDDLSLLRVCCREAAVQLDNVTLRARQQALIHDLGERSDQLAAVNKELEAFSYSVSHDLRAPLRHIGGFAQLLDKSAGASLDDQGRRYLRIISESAVKMGEMVDSLLVFSRMGRTQMHHARVDLNTLVRAAQREAAQAEPARSIAWHIHALPHVRGDQNMLHLVFTNLLANAVKYTRQREDATIEIGAMDGDAGETVVFVKDNGVGFDMAYADQLFGVFQRLHRAEEFEGTGIGLANVQRIVARHGGRVWAEAEPGTGATFYVALPADGS